MKDNVKRDEIVPYKILRKPSPMPYLCTGIAFLVYGWRFSIVNPWDYAKGAIVAVAVYALTRGIWPDRKIKIELPPDTGDQKTDQLLREARDTLVAFRAANDNIADAKVSACIEAIETACVKILNRLEEETALYGQLRTFLNYYLPTTRKLLEARAAIEQSGERGENAMLVRERTDRILPEIQKAFEKQLEAMDKHRYLDLQVEIDVLEGMLKSDGFGDA